MNTGGMPLPAGKVATEANYVQRSWQHLPAQVVDKSEILWYNIYGKITQRSYLMGRIINTPEGFIKKTIFVDLGENIKAAVLVSERTYGYADMAGVRYREMYNVKEPFDFKTHHFIMPKDVITKAGGFFMTATPERLGKVFTDMCDCVKVWVEYSTDMLVAYDDAVSSMDRHLSLSHEEKADICEGVSYSIEHYVTEKDEPVVVHLLSFDPEKATMITGTPNGTYDYRDQKQTVMGEALYEKSTGKDVLAAFNADFFDMFGDCAPSGLCVKNGSIIANPDSDRYFFGIKNDGTPIIDTLAGNPSLLSELRDAVCGINLLLSDGELCDVGVAEPFGYIAHPRTVAGICGDGKVIVAVIDGRRPWHSNGATLTDAALLLKAHGAVRGINLDGGGSSTFIVKTDDGELTMLNHPADLHRPTEDLIRDVFNSIIIVKK